MQQPFYDVSQYWSRRKPQLQRCLSEVLDSGVFLKGHQTSALATEFAAWLRPSANKNEQLINVLPVANGTDALEIALSALKVAGKKVIVPSHTATATVCAIINANAIPEFVDIGGDYLIDAESVAEVMTNDVGAIIAVHLYGNVCDMDALGEISRRFGVPLIEDCSQAHGAELSGRKVGVLSDISIFSCYPTKILGAIGDAGLICTTNPEIFDRCQRMHQYGWNSERVSVDPGGRNSRIDELQASFLRLRLSCADEDLRERERFASGYLNALRGYEECIRVPFFRKGVRHAWHLFVIGVTDRAFFVEFMKLKGVGTAIHYSTPNHLHPAFAKFSRRSLPVTESICSNIISVPLFNGLSTEAHEYVMSCLLAFCRQ